jgi:hypothetical protein
VRNSLCAVVRLSLDRDDGVDCSIDISINLLPSIRSALCTPHSRRRDEEPPVGHKGGQVEQHHVHGDVAVLGASQVRISSPDHEQHQPRSGQRRQPGKNPGKGRQHESDRPNTSSVPMNHTVPCEMSSTHAIFLTNFSFGCDSFSAPLPGTPRPTAPELPTTLCSCQILL